MSDDKAREYITTLLLLTPGPLTTDEQTRAAMQRDWGSRNRDFIDLTATIRHKLMGLVANSDHYTAVLLQGSGTFAVEAMIGTFVPPDCAPLVLENGVYGRRIEQICARIGRACMTITGPENQPTDIAALDAPLENNPKITHVAAVHVETTTGVLNPLTQIAEVVQQHKRHLLVDAMSGFGAFDYDLKTTPFTALAASSNKCLEGVPGLGFVIAGEDALSAAAGNAPSAATNTKGKS